MGGAKAALGRKEIKKGERGAWLYAALGRAALQTDKAAFREKIRAQGWCAET